MLTGFQVWLKLHLTSAKLKIKRYGGQQWGGSSSLMGACESAANLSLKSVFISSVYVFSTECLRLNIHKCFFLFIPRWTGVVVIRINVTAVGRTFLRLILWYKYDPFQGCFVWNIYISYHSTSTQVDLRKLRAGSNSGLFSLHIWTLYTNTNTVMVSIPIPLYQYKFQFLNHFHHIYTNTNTNIPIPLSLPVYQYQYQYQYITVNTSTSTNTNTYISISPLH